MEERGNKLIIDAKTHQSNNVVDKLHKFLCLSVCV